MPPFQEFQMPPPDYQMVATTVTTTQVTQTRYEWQGMVTYQETTTTSQQVFWNYLPVS